MHEMETIVTDVWGVFHVAQLSFTVQGMAELIKMLTGVNTPEGLCNIVLDGGPDTPTVRGGGINAVFVKLLWSLVCYTLVL